MAAEIKNLDTDLQMLVYENYNKFISATETIKRMKTNIVGMEGNMENLLWKVLGLFGLANWYFASFLGLGIEKNLSFFFTNLFYYRYYQYNLEVMVLTLLFLRIENTEKLHRTRNLLRKVQVHSLKEQFLDKLEQSLGDLQLHFYIMNDSSLNPEESSKEQFIDSVPPAHEHSGRSQSKSYIIVGVWL